MTLSTQFNALNQDITFDLLKYIPLRDLISYELLSKQFKWTIRSYLKGISGLKFTTRRRQSFPLICSNSKHEIRDWQIVAFRTLKTKSALKLLRRCCRLRTLIWELDSSFIISYLSRKGVTNLEHLELDLGTFNGQRLDLLVDMIKTCDLTCLRFFLSSQFGSHRRYTKERPQLLELITKSPKLSSLAFEMRPNKVSTLLEVLKRVKLEHFASTQKQGDGFYD